MQERDVISIEYLEDSARIADLVNGYVYKGREMFCPEDVSEVSRSAARIGKESARHSAQVITADVVRKLGNAMQVRVRNVESMNYHKQWRQTAKRHRQLKDVRGAEFLSGFAKNDKLIPVITIVIYLGKTPWDGPRSLKDMLKLEDTDEVKELVADYPIHLLEVRSYEKLEHFKTDLQQVFGFLQREGDKNSLSEYVEQHKDVFANLSEDAYDMISVMTRTKSLKELKNENIVEGGRVNMCKAIDDMIKDGEKRGEKRANRLVSLLAEQNRIQDIVKAASDEGYQEKLFAEFGL